jgi:hypothetical protein
LQAAAVSGRIFWEGPVLDLLEGAQPDFQLLETRDFVRRRSGSTLEGEREYAFKHSVTREVAYGSVPKARRARLHAAFASWLEEFGGGRDEHAPLLAHHYAQAVQPEDADLAWSDEPAEAERLREKAATWLRRAGELAVSRYDLDEGLALLQQAVELEEDTRAQAELWRAIGTANALGFRGAEFWQAMERSLELTDDGPTRAETYAELGYQTSFRSGMWTRAPDRALVSSWIGKGIELTEPGTAARVKALCARVYWEEEWDAEAAREAIDTAEQLGVTDLRAAAFFARSLVAFHENRFDEALEWAQRPLDFVDELNDPERVVEVYESIVPVDVMLGRFKAARAMSEFHEAATQPLSPHHRLHGIAVRAELEELSGGWETLRDLTPRIEQTVAENLRTPCVRNERTLLVCAGASRILGDVAESERLEVKAESLGMEGYDFVLAAPRLRLALLKDDLAAAERLVVSMPDATSRKHSYWSNLSAQVARLDALIRLGDRKRVEEEAEPLLELKRTYIEPFALRALGQVRGDRSLLEQALARFEELSLDWHGEQTRRLLTA